ncbi:MAG: peptidyl-prolyl cis-trans isomerase [Pseudomonadota bacterium]|uniref:peptidyl-prolyl cis-trans isomerase n=1 Tax=Roseovarius sp. TaxID=1486281 RepID=UPI003565DAF6
MAAKSISRTLVWILMGLLILGLGGFGATNFSGTVSNVGRVGDAEIRVDDYARTLQNEIRAREAERSAAMTFQQAREEGIPDRVLSQLVATAAFDHETGRLGISIGDENLREQIIDIEAFQGVNGNFDREAYQFALDRAGLSESEFEDDMRRETARALVQSAAMSGLSMPEGYKDTLLTYLGEERDVTYAALGRADLATGLPEPTEQELRDYHQGNLPQFTTPETKRISYALLTPEMIIDSVEVDEQALREAYDEQIDEFRQPERRLVERLAFSDINAAEAAMERIESGEAGFETLVEDRGLDLADVDLGDVARDDLGAAADPVFAAEAGDVVGPLDTDLGPALFRVNAVLAAQETTFEEAEPALRDALAGDRARRVIDNSVGRIDDLLAGGATIEDLVAETDMQGGTIDWHPGITDGIGAYDAFREAAAQITTDDYPEIIHLSDGGIFAMRLEEVVEPEVQPLETVRDAVRAGWRDQAAVAALKEQAQGQLDDLQSGADFADLGLSPRTAEGLTRRGFQPETPRDFIETVFGMDNGDVTLLEGDAQVFIIRVEAVRPPASDSDDLEQLRSALQEQAASGLAQDIYQMLAADIRQRAGIEIDQQAINAVHSNFQ